MKTFLLVFVFAITGLYFLGEQVQSSGTYTPSVNIGSRKISDNPEEIANNIHSYFKNAFEEIPTIPGVEKAWRHRIHNNVILSHYKVEQVRPHVLSDLKPKVYVKALPETRELIHLFGGIQDWKLVKAAFDKKNNQGLARFKLKGVYKNRKKKNILFYERHVFQGRWFYQWQLNLPDALEGILNDKVALALFEYMEGRK
ncbi:MAG: hypothetical protein ACJAT2_000890 [Bacteriovoracaceae bacterium]|jgi:hypothetical protein